jgi:5-methylcytosine-specific restriction endonuclease McrA
MIDKSKLTVVRKSKNHQKYYLVQCADCGINIEVRGDGLKEEGNHCSKCIAARSLKTKLSYGYDFGKEHRGIPLSQERRDAIGKFFTGHRYNVGRKRSEETKLKQHIVHRQKHPIENTILTSMFNHVKFGAKKKGLKFDLTRDEVNELVSGNCYYCGVGPSNKHRTSSMEKMVFLYNGVDRQNNLLGYVKDNVVSCCWRCNCAKGKLTLVEFKNWLTRIKDRNDGFINDKLENRFYGVAKLHYGNLKPFGYSTIHNYFCSYRHSAEVRKLSFEITFEQFYEITGENCTYCGEHPETRNKKFNFKHNGAARSSSIDRIDSSLGYTLNNVVPACSQCNHAKNTMSQEEFKEHTGKLIKNYLDYDASY